MLSKTRKILDSEKSVTERVDLREIKKPNRRQFIWFNVRSTDASTKHRFIEEEVDHIIDDDTQLVDLKKTKHGGRTSEDFLPARMPHRIVGMMGRGGVERKNINVHL